MNERAYTAWLGTLDDATRNLAQQIMARVGALHNAERDRHDRAVQRLERRDGALSEQISQVNIRLDHYEQARLDEVTRKLIEFADAQLPEEERTALIEVLYRVASDVSALKAKVFGADDDASNEASTQQPG